MTPLTVGKNFYTGQTAYIKCEKNDDLQNINIKDNSFLLLMVYDGNAYFKVGDDAFEAVGPCFVCFDEREQPRLVRSSGLKCDSIYFLPRFLNENITFEQVHSECYDRLNFVHDMLMMEPFTNEKRFVFPMFEDDIARLKHLYGALQKEL
ncbi:MAG: hypothetical protein IKL40_05715, partial [Clostridia bacterium]|nr:hypothetical protein [Clostridia bacterium]